MIGCGVRAAPILRWGFALATFASNATPYSAVQFQSDGSDEEEAVVVVVKFDAPGALFNHYYSKAAVY